MLLRTLLLPLLGHWTGAERLVESAWGPAGEARAVLTFRVDVGDTVVLQDYRQVRADGQELTGHGVLLLDPAVAAGPADLLWWFFDSDGHVPDPAPGRWDGSSLVLERHTPRGVARHELTPDADTLTYRIDVQPAGEPSARPFLRGRYRRISGH